MTPKGYLIVSGENKWTDTISPVSGAEQTVRVACHGCGQVLCTTQVKSNAPSPYLATVPAALCLCQMPNKALLAFVQEDFPYLSDGVWTQILGNFAEAALIAGASLAHAEECVERACRSSWAHRAREVLRNVKMITILHEVLSDKVSPRP